MRLILFFSCILSLNSFSQGIQQYIKDNAIEIESLDNLSPSVYNGFKDYDIIMVGETHGTEEPATFVLGLAESIIKKENSVAIGVEIPRSQMVEFIQSPSAETLIKTQFFSQENKDGRKSKAWFDLILSCSKNDNINLFFIDNFDTPGADARDKAMYESIKEYHELHPNEKIITLTGDIHNSLIPMYNVDRMGTLLLKDNEFFTPEKICSVRHFFNGGTTYSNKGNGLEIHNYNFGDNDYSTAVNYNNYLLFYESAEPSSNNCLLFSRKVTHSLGVNQGLE